MPECALEGAMDRATAATESRLEWLDLGRCIAALCVIAIHVSGVFCKEVTSPPFYAANFIDGFSRFCVPVFFMFSGYILCGRTIKEPTRYVFSKNWRLLKAYALAAAIYYAFDRWYQHLDMSAWPARLLEGQAHFHLWFIPALICVYFFVPIFMRIRSEDKKYIAVFVLVSFAIINYSAIMRTSIGAQPIFSTMTEIGPLYFLAGYCADALCKCRRAIYLAVFVASSLAIGVADIAIAQHQFKFPGVEPGSYAGVFVLLQSVSFFMLLKDIRLNGRAADLVRKTAGLTFGIYIFHHAFMIFIFDTLYHSGFGHMQVMLMTIPIAFVVAGIFTAMVKQIPAIGRVL